VAVGTACTMFAVIVFVQLTDGMLLNVVLNATVPVTPGVAAIVTAKELALPAILGVVVLKPEVIVGVVVAYTKSPATIIGPGIELRDGLITTCAASAAVVKSTSNTTSLIRI